MATNSNLRKGGAEERILSTAAGLFATFGYNGVSTRDIASGAEVNEVTIYRHHPRKRDLYMAVLEAELQQVKLRGDLLARVAEAGDGKMVLARTFELIAATLTQRPELLRLMQFSVLELGEDLNPLLRRHLGEFVEVIARYLEPLGRGWEAGRVEREGRGVGDDIDGCQLRLAAPDVPGWKAGDGGDDRRIRGLVPHSAGRDEELGRRHDETRRGLFCLSW